MKAVMISIPTATFEALEAKLAAARKLADAVEDWLNVDVFRRTIIEDTLRAFREADK